MIELRKILVLFVLSILLSACDNCRYETIQTKIGEISFDGEIITFYDEQNYRGDLPTGRQFYYQTESSRDEKSGPLLSEDGSLRMFVDFGGYEEVLDSSGMIVAPSYCLDYEDKPVHIYILKTSEVHNVRSKGMDDYSFSYMGEFGYVSIDLNFEKLQTEIKGWTRLEGCPEYASASNFDVFLEVTKNRREVGELIRTWNFSKFELDDGKWVVFICEYEGDYYLLDTNQVKALIQLFE